VESETIPGTAAAIPAPERPSHLAGLAVGRIVHYVLPSGPNQGEHRPAIVVKIWLPGQDTVQLQVFIDGANDGPEYTSGLHWATSVSHAPAQAHRWGSWHWPEFVK
jgi:hypothetical protein